MKIPEKVRIGGRDYEIRHTENLNDGVNLAYGHIDYEQGVLRIMKGLGHEKACITLWHEMLHGVIEHFGLKIENEEEAVCVLAKGIYELMADNGEKLYDIISEEKIKMLYERLKNA